MLVAAILAVDQNVSPIYQVAFVVPSIAIESSMVCKMIRAMIIRSLDVDLHGSLAPTEVSDFPFDATFELNTRATDGELEEVR